MQYQPTWYLFGSQPVHIMSKAELYFIQVEVQLRSNIDATSAYQKAVEASVTEILTWFGDEATVPAAATTAKAYAMSLGTPTLQKLSNRSMWRKHWMNKWKLTTTYAV